MTHLTSAQILKLVSSHLTSFMYRPTSSHLLVAQPSGRSLADREVDVIRALRVASGRQGYSLSHVSDEPQKYGVDPSISKREGTTSTTWILCERPEQGHSGARSERGEGRLPKAALPSLLARGICVCDSFISDQLVGGLAADIQLLRGTSTPTEASPLHGSVEWYKLLPPPAWSIHAPPEPAARTQLYSIVSELRRGLERGTELGAGLPLSDHLTELRYSYYPSGGHYQRHLDARVSAEGGRQRCFSFILYLNSQWSETDGGCLRAYDESGGHVDIPPRGGTLVIFRSANVPHEVLPTSSQRMCIVGWFNHLVTPTMEATDQTSNSEEGQPELSELGQAILDHYRKQGEDVKLRGPM